MEGGREGVRTVHRMRGRVESCGAAQSAAMLHAVTSAGVEWAHRGARTQRGREDVGTRLASTMHLRFLLRLASSGVPCAWEMGGSAR